MLYAVDLLAKTFQAQCFAARSDLIKRGVVSYLAQDFATAAYSLFPQADGILFQILHEDGLLRARPGNFPIWTKEHPDIALHGKPCTNILAAAKGAASAESACRLGHLLKWLGDDQLLAVTSLRNRLLHGQLLGAQEHEVSVVVLLQVLYHGIAPQTGSQS